MGKRAAATPRLQGRATAAVAASSSLSAPGIAASNGYIPANNGSSSTGHSDLPANNGSSSTGDSEWYAFLD
jgi:hypothetical protein